MAKSKQDVHFVVTRIVPNGHLFNSLDSAGMVPDLKQCLEAASLVGSWHWNIVRSSVTLDAGMADLLMHDPGYAGIELSSSNTQFQVRRAEIEWLSFKVIEAVNGDGRIEAECRTVSRDGSERTIRVLGRVIKDGAGHPIQALGIAVDVHATGDSGPGRLDDEMESLEACADHLVAARHSAGARLLRSLIDMALQEVGTLLGARLRRQHRSGLM